VAPGSPAQRSRKARGPRRRGRKPSGDAGAVGGAEAPKRTLALDVVWGDITTAKGNAHVVGHYQDVLPQFAELALDKAVSGPDATEDRLILTSLTRAGTIRGTLGDVFFVPWSRGTVVVAGMGRPGLFRERELRVLWRSVVQTVGRLRSAETLCTVLIGAGAGNLQVPQAARNLLFGVVDAIKGDPRTSVSRIRIVERSLDRALEALETLKKYAAEVADHVSVEVTDNHVVEEGGVIPSAFCYSVLSAVVARARGLAPQSRLRIALTSILDQVPDASLRGQIERGLEMPASARKREAAEDLLKAALRFRLRDPETPPDQRIPSRVAFSRRDRNIQSSAITHTVTVAERTVTIRPALVDRAIDKLIRPSRDDHDRFGRALSRFLIHPDFRPIVEQETEHLVIEVDRDMARVPWEMLHSGGEPLGIRRPVARQLRTTYSPKPPDLHAPRQLRALVIGDPGTGAYVLESARRETLVVRNLLQSLDVDVELRVGAPQEGTGAGPVAGVKPADILDVTDLLTRSEFDIVHFSGHAYFDPLRADATGWLFANDEFLTGGDLGTLERAPSIIVANACLSAALATAPADVPRGSESGLVLGLADEFFKRGVYDYVGTAWEVRDEPARVFAEAFYRSLLSPEGTGTVGEAVQAARRSLYEQEKYGTVWAAYQHYGDPTRRLYSNRVQQGRR
jgi:hypothetical protein